MAIASAKAIAKIMAVCILEAASGFLPIDFEAVDPIQPIETAGNIVPIVITPTIDNKRIDSASMAIIFNLKIQI